VLCIDGFGWKGFLAKSAAVKSVGGSVEQFDYNNSVSSVENMRDATQKLDNYLSRTSGNVVVAGVSMGTQVAYKWLRSYSRSTSVDPDKVSFLMLAPPENKYTGVSVYGPNGFKGNGPYDGVGYPDDSPFRVHNLIRQYDGVADYPNVANPDFWAVLNAQIGMAVIHMNYMSVTPHSKGAVSSLEGNQKTTWVRSGIPPSVLVPRKTLEKAYNRPVGSIL
jgi:hypothetical protein